VFDDVVELDMKSLEAIEAADFLLTVTLFQHPEFGYITVMQIPDDNGGVTTRVQQLPEPIQNMIPVYLPMILGG
jgi:hypothetical protein